MFKIILVGVGGFAGSVLRYIISGYVQQLAKSVVFPYGTLAVNVVGCLIIGFLSQLAESRGLFSADARVLIFTGFLGGFTTFSTFGNETMNLFRDGENVSALVNLGAHVILGLASVWLGRVLVHAVWR